MRKKVTVRIALVGLQLGVQYTLATTSFVVSLADGLERIGIHPRIYGLVHWQTSWGQGWESQWDPAPLAPFEVAAPWIGPPRQRTRDALAAMRLGVLDTAEYEDGTVWSSPDWYLEYLLERDLADFAGPDPDLTLVVYPIHFPTLSAVSRVARRRGWRVLVQSCEAMSGSWIDPKTKDAYIQMVTQDTDGVWALSDYLAEYWIGRGMPADRILVHPNIVRQASFETAVEARAGGAVYLGNLAHKEIEYLLDIAAIVRLSVPEFRLRIYGDAPAERRQELSAEVADCGLGEVVTFELPVSPSAVPSVAGAADVLLLPRSKGEFSAAGFPNKLGEYLASGRPVVVTRVGDIPRYLVDGVSAYLVEPDDVQAFAEAVLDALGNPEAADRIGAEGRRVAEDLLASPVVARRIVDFIMALPLRRSPASSANNAWQRTRLIACRLWSLLRQQTRRLGATPLHWARTAYRILRSVPGRLKTRR